MYSPTEILGNYADTYHSNPETQHSLRQPTEPLLPKVLSLKTVIYLVRTSDVLAFTQRLGIKGAADLKHKDGLVALCGHLAILNGNQDPLHDFKIHLPPPGQEGICWVLLSGHTTARLPAQASSCHSDTNKLEIISSKPYIIPNTERFHLSSHLLKSELVKEVLRSVADAHLAQEARVSLIQEKSQEYC